MYDGRGYYQPSLEGQALTALWVIPGTVFLIGSWFYAIIKEEHGRQTTRTWLHEVQAGRPSLYLPRSK
jgi:cytochrome c-type biogenesis protein CcmH/NrfF